MIIQEPAGLKIAFGENPKKSIVMEQKSPLRVWEYGITSGIIL